MFSRILAVLADAVRRMRAAASRRPNGGFAGTRGAGTRGEALAVAELRRRGYRVLERNFRTPVGEIDVVAEEGETLCFVEVKWRRGTAMGHPGEAVTAEKQRRIARAAEWYLARRRGPARPCRFDVVAIIATPDPVAIIAAPDEAASVELVRDAFRGPFPPRRRR
jgi:putative endonuclease